MRARLVHTVAAAALLGALLGAPAFAQADYTGVQNHTDLTADDVYTTQGDVDETGDGAVASHNSVGVEGTGGRSVSANSVQNDSGPAYATVSANIGSANVSAFGASTSHNALSASSEGGDISVDAEQNAAGELLSTTNIGVGTAGVSVGAAASSANATSISSVNGDVNASVTQNNDGAVGASSSTYAVESQSLFSAATSIANDVAVDSEAADINLTTEQNNTATVVGTRSDLYGQHMGDAATFSSATGNAVSAYTQSGAVTARARQNNEAIVGATAAAVQLDGSWTGVGVVNVNGVGNMANYGGADMDVAIDQNNSGPILAYGVMSGGDGFASSTAIGNSVTVAGCGACGPQGGFAAEANQTNTGDVTAIANVRRRGATTGSATAAGNAATYIVTSE